MKNYGVMLLTGAALLATSLICEQLITERAPLPPFAVAAPAHPAITAYIASATLRGGLSYRFAEPAPQRQAVSWLDRRLSSDYAIGTGRR